MSITIARIKSLDETKIKTLDYLDTKVMPADEPYPKNGSIWWLAFDKSEPIGFFGLKVWDDSYGFLCRAGVLKEYRGQGIHKRGITVRERLCVSLGLKSIVTYVAPHNLRSANALIRKGYILYRPMAKWGMENALYFRKDL